MRCSPSRRIYAVVLSQMRFNSTYDDWRACQPEHLLRWSTPFPKRTAALRTTSTQSIAHKRANGTICLPTASVGCHIDWWDASSRRHHAWWWECVAFASKWCKNRGGCSQEQASASEACQRTVRRWQLWPGACRPRTVHGPNGPRNPRVHHFTLISYQGTARAHACTTQVWRAALQQRMRDGCCWQWHQCRDGSTPPRTG